MKECLHTTDAAIHCHARDQNAFIDTRSTYATTCTPREFSRREHLSANDAGILSPYSCSASPNPRCIIVPSSHIARRSAYALFAACFWSAHTRGSWRGITTRVSARVLCLNSCGAQGSRSRAQSALKSTRRLLVRPTYRRWCMLSMDGDLKNSVEGSLDTLCCSGHGPSAVASLSKLTMATVKSLASRRCQASEGGHN